MSSLEKLFASLDKLTDVAVNGVIGAGIKYLSSRNGGDSLRFGIITGVGTYLYDSYTGINSSPCFDPMRVTSLSAYTGGIQYLLGASGERSVNDALLAVVSSSSSTLFYKFYQTDDEPIRDNFYDTPPAKCSQWVDSVSS